MGYIDKTKKEIEAYLTPRGKELFLNGEKSDTIIKYFSLGDSDRNYLIEDFEFQIPDVSGDNDDCIRSLANGLDIKYIIPPLPLQIPQLIYITDGSLTTIGNESEIFSIGIADNISRPYNITLNLNTTILSKAEWFDKIVYKNIEYSNVLDFTFTDIEIPAGNLQSSPIQVYFKNIPFSQPFSLVQSISILFRMSNFSNATQSINDIITITRTQDSYPPLILKNVVYNRVSCSSTNNGSITGEAEGGSGVYTFYLKNNTTNLEVSNTTCLFENLVVGNYTLRVVDSVNFQNQQTGDITKATDFTIANTTITNVSTSNGSIKIDLTGDDDVYQYRLYSLPENTLITQTTLLSQKTYTFSIPDSYLPVVTNTPFEYAKYKDFRIDVYNPSCGTKSVSNLRVSNVNPVYAVADIFCEVINFANTGNRLYNQKDINIYSLTSGQYKRDINGNIEVLFYDNNPTICPITLPTFSTFELLSGNSPQYITIPCNLSIMYTAWNNGNVYTNTLSENNTNFGTVHTFLPNDNILISVLNPLSALNLKILEDNVEIYNTDWFDVNNPLIYNLTTSQFYYKIIVTLISLA